MNTFAGLFLVFHDIFQTFEIPWYFMAGKAIQIFPGFQGGVRTMCKLSDLIHIRKGWHF